MIELRDLRVVRDAFVLELDAVIDAPCTALLGASGSGKTTLLEAIAGLLRPQRGRIVIDGEIVSDAAARRFEPARRRRVGYVPQDGALFPHLSVRGNLLYGSHGEPRREAELDHVAGVLSIGALLDRRVPSLSGGEKRRVALGRALLAGPRLLLLDEPLTGLDRARREDAIGLLARVRDAMRVPMILVTHDESEARRLATASIELEDGRISAASRPPVAGA